MKTLDIATAFSPHPAGRTDAEGPHAAERFRREALDPALRAAMASGESLVVSFEGLEACSAGFIEEAFGGLARDPAFHPERVDYALVLRGEGAPYERMVEDALKAMRAARKRPAAAA